jgi:DNA-binding winged helix-turn-helix (wHTH) protein
VSSNPQDYIRAWLASWDFIDNPFALWEAGQEPWLDRYFIRPPFFEQLLHHHKSTLVFAPRGGGKTATRLMIEAECRPALTSSSVLAVSFTDFSPLIDSTLHLDQLTLANYQIYLLSAILRQLLIALAIRETRSSLLDEDMLGELRYWTKTYLPELSHPRPLAVLFGQMAPEVDKRRLMEAAKEFQHGRLPLNEMPANIQSLGRLLNTLMIKEPVCPRDPLDSPSRKLSVLVEFCLTLLSDRPIPCHALYLLIDGVDEYMLTQSDPFASVALIRPILSNLHFLELPGLAVKCFLPAEQRQAFEREARIDRLDVITLEWRTPTERDEPDFLRELLRRRITAFNTRGVISLGELCAPAMRSWLEDEMLKQAHGSPRTLMRLGAMLFAEHCRDRAAPESVLQPETWEHALERFRASILQEQKGPSQVALEVENIVPSPDLPTGFPTSSIIPLLRVDTDSGRVYRGDEELVGLADLEYRLLATLYERRGQICDKDTIVKNVYEKKYAPEDHDKFGGVTDEAISRLIRRVRLRIEPLRGGEPLYLKTIKGRGYLLNYTE